MPSTTSTVGSLTLPVPAGSANSKLADPTVDGLLDYFAFWTKQALDTKVATLTGTSSDAVPSANRFSFDPTDPRGHHVRLPVPALFVWWGGTSTRSHETLVYVWRQRELEMLYVFGELPQLVTMEKRAGLLAAVDAAWHKASERGRHPSYGYNGALAGTPLRQSLGGFERFAFEYVGGRVGRFGIDDGKGRDYPALMGRLSVWERIDGDTLEDPTDILLDSTLALNTTDGETADTTAFMDRLLPAPDGSEFEGTEE